MTVVRQFLLWARTAPAADRAEAVAALGGAYLYTELSPSDRREAATAMTAMLDDPSPLVRLALAESLAHAWQAPRHVILALARDQTDIAMLVLARSPVLVDADLVDCAALGGEAVQIAITHRPYVSTAVSGALAEIAGPAALASLARNPGAEIAPGSLARMVERHGDDAALREALLSRPDLPLAVRQAVAVALARSLEHFVVGRGWLGRERCERLTREAGEKATIVLSASAERPDLGGLVSHLRRSGQLTPALILRAVLSGGTRFAEAAFAEIADLPLRQVAGLMGEGGGSGFAALYRKAGLPPRLQPAFAAAIAASRERPQPLSAGTKLSRPMIERALSACAALPPEEAGPITALLRGYEVEAIRGEAREIAGEIADVAALAAVLEHEPEALFGRFARPRLRQAA